jgi:hypothetical protein
MCPKVFRRRMVLEGDEGNLVKVAVEILERGKERTNKTVSRSYQRALDVPLFEGVSFYPKMWHTGF